MFLAALSIRHAHTDVQVPNFDYYRRKARLDPSKSYRDAGDATSPYSYLPPIGKHIDKIRDFTIPCEVGRSVPVEFFKRTSYKYEVLRRKAWL